VSPEKPEPIDAEFEVITPADPMPSKSIDGWEIGFAVLVFAVSTLILVFVVSPIARWGADWVVYDLFNAPRS
jgi:hypothetical protein